MKTISLCRYAFALPLLFISQQFIHAPQASADEATLIQKQAAVKNRYQRLEELLLRLADVEAAENPDRAAVLLRAARQSRDKFVLDKLNNATESLRAKAFQDAIENQGSAAAELQSILKLLMSEDRSKRLRKDKDRFANLIKELKRLVGAQRSTRARTENGADLKDVQSEQKSITNRSKEAKEKISDEAEAYETPKDQKEKDADSKDGKSGDKKDGENKDGKSGDKKDGENKGGKSGDKKDGENKDGNKKDGDKKDAKPGDKKDGDKKDGKSGEPKDGEQKDGEPKSGEQKSGEQKSGEQKSGEQKSGEQKSGEQKSGEQKSGEQKSGQQSSEQKPPSSPEEAAEQQLQKAIEKMQQAQEELKQANRDEATIKQRDAEEEIRKAIDRLERILRQLREEEMQRELARLESRLRKMAALQSRILDDTVALSATPVEQRNRHVDLKAGDLAFAEKDVTLEADRAMLLLREEGSSVAFPEVLDQIRGDTRVVAERLAETKIDVVTQGIQKDILAALEEMIATTQKAQRDLEKKQQQQQSQQQQQQGSQEEPLVQALAELKLIRTMEIRIKSTTQRYADIIAAGETDDGLLRLIQNLSDRQSRLYQVTRDLVQKRNK